MEVASEPNFQLFRPPWRPGKGSQEGGGEPRGTAPYEPPQWFPMMPFDICDLYEQIWRLFEAFLKILHFNYFSLINTLHDVTEKGRIFEGLEITMLSSERRAEVTPRSHAAFY